MNKNQAFFGIVTSLMCASFLISCSGHDSHRRAAAPTPTATAYLGIEKMWRGHLVSINRNVLAVWVDPRPKADAYDTSIYVLSHLEPALKQSEFQVIIINVGAARGIVTTTEAYIYVNDANGNWVRLEDKAMIDNIAQAGL